MRRNERVERPVATLLASAAKVSVIPMRVHLVPAENTVSDGDGASCTDG